ncbi:MAG TPA: hypothetical protein VNA11_05020 [Pseudonocardia sp.]|nr:hypothetical protein [Pseudonocardia sp.]
MTDRRPDRTVGPEHGDATVRLTRGPAGPEVAPTGLAVAGPRGDADPPPSDPPSSENAPAPGPGPASGPGSGSFDAVASDETKPVDPSLVPPPRDERTVDLTKRETETVRVDHEPRSPWARPPGPGAQPSAPYQPGPPEPPAATSWPSAQPPPWSAAQQTPQHTPPWSAPPPRWGATRAMPQPPMSPPLPQPRGRGSGPLIVFGILAALLLVGGAWALITLVAGNSPFGPKPVDDPVAGGPSISTDAPVPTDPIQPLPPTDPDPDGNTPSDGPTGQVVVTWTLSGVDYRATLTTTGSTGNAVVTYVDPTPPGQQRTVRQDLTLASSGGQRAYVGSSPVDADTGVPSDYYAPDVFMLATNDEGSVYIDQVCDTSGLCAPATMG